MATTNAESTTPRWWPAGWYYGWALVTTLGVTTCVSYGVLSYAFAAFILPMSVELGWSKTSITGAFSLAQLVAGGAAVPVGRWIDAHGTRTLMTSGAILASLMLGAWSQVRTLPAFYLVWVLMGCAMATVLYEPAFAVTATWFDRHRTRAFTVLTFIGGLASVIFVPISTTLIEAEGWRKALLMLALIYAVLTIVPHAVLLRRHPSSVGQAMDGAKSSADSDRAPATVALFSTARAAISSAPFRRLAFVFAIAGLVSTAMTVHLIPLLLERGYSAAFAGGAMGVLGLMALPGRLLFTPLGERWSRTTVTAVILALQALALVLLLTVQSRMSVWLFVALFGAGFGAITPARASLVAEIFGTQQYGRVAGALAFLLSFARAAAPVGASLIYGLGSRGLHGYNLVLGTSACLCVASAFGAYFISTPAWSRRRSTLSWHQT